MHEDSLLTRLTGTPEVGSHSLGSGDQSYELDIGLYKTLGKPDEIFFRTLLRENMRRKIK